MRAVHHIMKDGIDLIGGNAGVPREVPSRAELPGTRDGQDSSHIAQGSRRPRPDDPPTDRERDPDGVNVNAGEQPRGCPQGRGDAPTC